MKWKNDGFHNDEDLIRKYDNIKINWNDNESHSIINRIRDRALSFKSMKDFNKYINKKLPLILEIKNENILNGKYAFYDKEYNLTIFIKMKDKYKDKISIITILSGYIDNDAVKCFEI